MSTENIFRTYAPLYHAAGINVIPLYAKSKRPLINAWSDYAGFPIPDEVHKAWLAMPDNHNIGVVLGKQSNLGMLDIDYADDHLIEAIKSVLPEGYATWTRVGKKGMVFAFRFNPKVPDAFKLISKELGTICEYLCTGQQVVLPPSIHPETNKPYVANTNLYEVLDQLPMIPDDLEERLRNLIEMRGISLSGKGVGSLVEYVAAGGRDNSITAKAGLLAHEVISGRISLQKAIDSLYVIDSSFTEQVVGDAMDMDKHVNNLLKFIQKDLIRRKTVLPVGWDEELEPKVKTALEANEVFLTEATYEQILEWYNVEADNTVGEHLQLLLIDEAIFKISQIRNEDRMRESFIINKIVQKSGLGIRPADLKARITAKRDELKKIVAIGGDDEGNGATDISLNTHTEVAMAALDFLNSIHPIRVDAGLLYKFMGTHWVAYPADQVKQYIAKTYATLDIMRRNSDIDGVYKQMLILADAGLEKIFHSFVNVANGMIVENENAKIDENSPELQKRIEAIKAHVLTLPQVEAGMWSDEEVLTAQNNAVTRFLEGRKSPLQFTNHDADFGATYVLPYRYVPELAGKMPLFSQFLKDCWGHRADFEQMLMALQEALYVSFMGCATKYQRAFLLFGVANSGKSVLLKIIASLFPDETKSSVSFDKMNENRQLISLHRKNINIIGELSERKRIEGDIFKSVIDGTPISAYPLYREAFTMHPNAAHWAASNHLPKTYDTSEGFTRRWLFFHFDEQVPADRVDVDLAKKIITQEREAIFAWALDAGHRLIKQQGFTLPKSHGRLMATLAYQTNPALFFLVRDPTLEICKYMPEAKQKEVYECTELDLHLQFRQFMRLSVGSSKNIEMQDFRHMLDEIIKSRGIERFTREGDLNQWYRGIRIKQTMRG